MVLTTGLSESASDYFVHRFSPGAAAAVAGLGLAVALAVQFTTRRHVPFRYWLAVTMVGGFGTTTADVLHAGLGVPYIASTVFFTAALAIILATWLLSERTLSMHSIDTFRREAFHWAAVVATFALGTATVDLTAVTLRLGYFSSSVAFALLIAAPAVACCRLGLSAIASFWFAYVLTRPLGASLADALAASGARGGFDFGAGRVSLVLAALVAAVVAYLTITQQEVSMRRDNVTPAQAIPQ